MVRLSPEILRKKISFLLLTATEKVNFVSHIHNFYCKLRHGQLTQSIILLVLLFHLPVSRIQSLFLSAFLPFGGRRPI